MHGCPLPRGKASLADRQMWNQHCSPALHLHRPYEGQAKLQSLLGRLRYAVDWRLPTFSMHHCPTCDGASGSLPAMALTQKHLDGSGDLKRSPLSPRNAGMVVVSQGAQVHMFSVGISDPTLCLARAKFLFPSEHAAKICSSLKGQLSRATCGGRTGLCFGNEKVWAPSICPQQLLQVQAISFTFGASPERLSSSEKRQRLSFCPKQLAHF